MSHELFRQPVVQQLGWTLLHFVWQGTIIAGAFALLQWGASSRPAAWRYISGCAALLAMLAAPVITFNALHKQPPLVTEFTAPLPSRAPLQHAEKTTSMELAAPTAAQPVPIPVKDWVSLRLQKSFPWLVSLWLLGVALFSLRLLIGSWQAFRLGRCCNEPIGEPYLQRFEELRRALAISRPVRLVKSLLVEVPTAIGWLRPVILLPVTTLTGLTPAQLESILAHELAHIRRHDYLINLLQNLIETLFFYHPAVWWVSHRIRIERENCCDDIAVTFCGNRLCYAKALATLEHLRGAPGSLALAANGGSLLTRIRRLYGVQTLARSRWQAGGSLVVLLAAMLTAFATIIDSRAITQYPQQGPPRSIVIADSVSDFSGIQSSNCWSYGYWQKTGDADGLYDPVREFVPMPRHGDIAFQGSAAWNINNDYWTGITAIGGHPNGVATSGGASPVEQWAIRRWVSPVAGGIIVTGLVAKFNTTGGDGTLGTILVDGTSVFATHIAAADGNGIGYSVQTTVKVGSLVDFIITPGPAADDAYDGTIFSGTVISKEPAPLPFAGTSMANQKY